MFDELPSVQKCQGRYLTKPWLDKNGIYREVRFDRLVIGKTIFWGNPMHRRGGTSRWIRKIK